MKIKIIKNQDTDSGFESDISSENWEKEKSNEIINSKKWTNVQLRYLMDHPGLRVFVFDIGQGNFNLIFHRETKSLAVIDGGTTSNDRISIAGEKGEKIGNFPQSIITDLLNQGVVENFYIIISHHDVDHYNLIVKILLSLQNIIETKLLDNTLKNFNIYLNPLLKADEETLSSRYAALQNKNNWQAQILPTSYNVYDNYKLIHDKSSKTDKWVKDNNTVRLSQSKSNELINSPMPYIVAYFNHFNNNMKQHIIQALQVRWSDKQEIKFGDSTKDPTITILRPEKILAKDFNNALQNITNMNSYVCKLTLPSQVALERSFLFSGDTTIDSIREIHQKDKNILKSDILITPHHGALDNSLNSRQIKTYISPQLVINSAPLVSDYSHPSYDFIKHIEEALQNMPDTLNHLLFAGYDSSRVLNPDKYSLSAKAEEPGSIKSIYENNTNKNKKIIAFNSKKPIFNTNSQGHIFISARNDKEYVRMRSYYYNSPNATDVTKSVFDETKSNHFNTPKDIVGFKRSFNYNAPNIAGDYLTKKVHGNPP